MQIIEKVRNNSFLRNSGIYLMSSIVNKAIPFLMIPFMTKNMTQESYGQVALLIAMITLLRPIISLSGPMYINVSYFKNPLEELKQDIFSTILISTVNLFVVGSIIIFTFQLFHFSLGINLQWLVLILLCSYSQEIIEILLNLLRVRKQALHFAILEISRTIINIAVSLILVISYQMQWQGRVTGILLSSYLGLLFVLIYLLNKELIIFKYTKSAIYKILKYSVPLVPSTISAWIINSSDRFFLAKFVGIKETGNYSLGYQIGMIILIITWSFSYAWTPHIFEILKKNIHAELTTLRRHILFYAIGLSVLALLLTIVTPFLIEIIATTEYISAASYFPWVAFGYVFYGINLTLQAFLLYDHKTITISYIMISSALINLILNYFFITRVGAIGVAIATLVTFGLTTLLLLMKLKKRKVI